MTFFHATPLLTFIVVIYPGESNVSIELTSKTLCGIPSPVVNATIGNKTSNSLTFHWDDPTHYNGDISTVEYKVGKPARTV
jgi:hypothetical protein